jgi:hypothetical protein
MDAKTLIQILSPYPLRQAIAKDMDAVHQYIEHDNRLLAQQFVPTDKQRLERHAAMMAVSNLDVCNRCGTSGRDFCRCHELPNYGNYIKGMEYKSKYRKRALDTASMPLPLFILPWFSRVLIALGLRKRASTLDYLETLDRWLDKKLTSS